LLESVELADESRDTLISRTARLLGETLDNAESDPGTKAGLLDALHKIDALVFLLSLTTDERANVSKIRREALHGRSH